MLNFENSQNYPDFRVLFESTPTPYLILAPDNFFTIVAVNPAYLRATMTQKEAIIGKALFQVFPDNPHDPNAFGERNLRASLRRVMQHHRPDAMPIQKYDIRRPEAENKEFEARYWCFVNTPVIRENNTLNYIIHRTEDVTEFMLLKQQKTENKFQLEERIQAEVYRHIKEIEVSQAALSLNYERYSLLISILPVGIFHTDAQGQCIYVSPQWLDIVGTEASKIQDKPWFEWVHPEDVPLVLTTWQNCQFTHDVCELELRFLLPNEGERWVFAQITPEIKEGEIQSYVGAITDITLLKQLEAKHLLAIQVSEEQQRQRAQEAETYQQSQDQFISATCHELRNPLNGILGNVTLSEYNIEKLLNLIKALPSEENNPQLKEDMLAYLRQIEESIQAIYTCAKHQKVITDDVLHLSKLEARKVELHFIEFHPQKMIQEVVMMLNSEITHKQLQLSLQFTEDDIIVTGDPDRLKQILLNLLSNAIKFTPSGGKLTLSLTISKIVESDRALCFTIEDTGIGMTAEEKTHIFERFTQAKYNTYHKYGGSGLGLAICKDLVKLMGGKIDVESCPGRGTTFSFTIHCPLPILQKAPPEALSIFTELNKHETTPLVQGSSPIQRNILIVDDDIVNQKVLKRFLEQAGHRCKIANHGSEAMLALEQEPFDLILMDTEMPVMNGLEATRLIRQDEQEQGKLPIPIIGLSGNIRQEQIAKAKNAGMNDYLTKPVEKNRLLEKISDYTQKKVPTELTQKHYTS